MKKSFFNVGKLLLLACGLFAGTANGQTDPLPPPTYYYEQTELGFVKDLPGASLTFTPEITMTCGNFVLHFDASKPVGFGLSNAYGAARRQVLCDVVSYISQHIQIPPSAVLDIDVVSDSILFGQPGYQQNIASAGPYSSAAYDSNTPGFYGGLLYDHIKSGSDPNATKNDAFVKVDFNNLHPPGTTNPSCFADFYILLLHEMTHALGFFSNVGIDVSSNTVVSKADSTTTGPFSMFDKFFLYKKSGSFFTKLVTGTTSGTIAAGITTNDLIGNSIWLTNAPDKTNLAIYSLPPYSKGSSLSHLDDNFAYDRCHTSPGFVPHYIMPSFYKFGTGRTEWTVEEVRTLQAMGYTIKTTSSFYPILTNHAPYVNGDVIAPFTPGQVPKYDDTMVGIDSRLSMTINSCQKAVIDLSARAELKDADGDKLFIYPNSLFNIRGCGSGTTSSEDHNQLAVTTSAAGDVITFTPRSNFVGKAQFGFHLWDKKERGAFVVYTIDVTRNDTCFNNGNELVINGSLEAGQEIRTDANPNTEYDYLWAQSYLFMYSPTFNYFTNWALYHLDGVFANVAGSVDPRIKDSFKECEYGNISRSYNASSNPAYIQNRFLDWVYGENTLVQLSEPMETCQTYTLDFDFQIPGAGPADSVELKIGFTNDPNNSLNINTSSFNKRITYGNGQWQHLHYTFTYNDAVLDNNILHIRPNGHWGNPSTSLYFFDNFSIQKVGVPYKVTLTKTDVSCAGNNDGSITANVTGGTPPYTFKWNTTPIQVSQTASLLYAGTYKVTVTDAAGCLRYGTATITQPTTPCAHCQRIYVAQFGVTKALDSLDASSVGGNYTFQTGNIHLLGSIKLKNGTFTIPSGTIFYMEGTKQANLVPDNGAFQYAPVIILENATLKVNGKIRAACDTIGGGIYSYFPNNYNPYTNRVEITGVPGDSAEVSDCQIGLEISDQSNAFLTNPAAIQRASFTIDKAVFLNNRLAVDALKYHNPTQVDQIQNSRFDSKPSNMKSPFNSGLEYSFGQIRLWYHVRNTIVQNNKINNCYYGVFNNGESVDVNVQNNTFNNNFVGAVWCYGGSELNQSQILNNTINFPTTKALGLPASMQGQTVGIYHGGIGLYVDGNIFNGQKIAGLQQQGVVHSIFADSKGLNIINNTFNNLNMGVNNLNLKYQGAGIGMNTFTSVDIPVLTDFNINLIPPVITLHCNNFIRGSISSVTSAILIGGNGQMGKLGDCSSGNTEGNKFTGYNTTNTYLAINNLCLTASPTYVKSFGETTNLAWGKTGGAVTLQNCTWGSNCPGGLGQILDLGAILEPLTPVVIVVQSAIAQLRRTIQPVVSDIENIRTVIAYYRGSCSPEYQNVVNSMLPANLAAYNTLGWNLAECAITQKNIPLALQMMNEIVYSNPGNIAIQMRSNYYQVILRTTGLSTYIGYRATVQDMDILAQVAASGTDFSAAACYALTGLDPQRGGNCVTLPNLSQVQRLGKPDEQENNSATPVVMLTNAPNPFSESTKVGYVLYGEVHKAVLKIFDVQGRFVKSMNLDITVNEITVYADDLNNGIYVYGIEADGVPSNTKGRMVVIK